MLYFFRFMLFPAFWALSLHPVHYSVLNIEYSEPENSFHCLWKIFRDDFYLMAFHHYGDQWNEKAIQDSVQSNYFIEKYVNTMAWLVIDRSDTVRFRITERIEKTDEQDVMWIKLQATPSRKFSRADMTNYLLMDVFPDQTNLVIFSCDGNEHGYQMTYESPTCTLDIGPGI